MNDTEYFQEWWDNDGSGIRPKPDDDMETFAKQVAYRAWRIAWHISRLYTIKRVVDDMAATDKEK